jgi:hypothetical protein
MEEGPVILVSAPFPLGIVGSPSYSVTGQLLLVAVGVVKHGALEVITTDTCRVPVPLRMVEMVLEVVGVPEFTPSMRHW